ncbi:hypothetical protein [Myroides odoratus]|uniref:Uncharacterized protein n=1 Tax=Myroides odoratus TaxID=256 RepID=A0A9Q6Z366_MYROD|nr:hypothetical protein [Myroides odoratus]EHQ41671.1 hypothetical protein Myrod_0835 [Myroides odoratus DSM 2801]EKB08839.1 hypothetical protein HMPREF9716_00609 [Myroides odoratus CIP 103059]QQT99078.1 hypothetical protein I6I88_12755 [Myroides odoratus]WQD58730.1 hypothetical protein U0010_06210 [Myroides odoratus]STZ28930.1 Uncharacterised protein [Myroides odoratus]
MRVIMSFLLKFVIVVGVVFATMSFTVTSKYEKIIYKSINTSEYTLIYQILKNNIEDFPEKENKSIKYKDYNTNYSFQIVLKSNHFRLKYLSNKTCNEKVDSIIAKIEEVTNNRQ